MNEFVMVYSHLSN